jgi:hypothetical protein
MSCQKYVPILLCPLGKSTLSFQERAELPSEYWDLVHHGIGTHFLTVAITPFATFTSLAYTRWVTYKRVPG